MDLAAGHIKALEWMFKAGGRGCDVSTLLRWCCVHARRLLARACQVFNLGTGTGYSVLDMVKAMERASGRAVKYVVGPRREGDLASVYADPAKVLRFARGAWGLQDALTSGAFAWAGARRAWVDGEAWARGHVQGRVGMAECESDGLPGRLSCGCAVTDIALSRWRRLVSTVNLRWRRLAWCRWASHSALVLKLLLIGGGCGCPSPATSHMWSGNDQSQQSS